MRVFLCFDMAGKKRSRRPRKDPNNLSGGTGDVKPQVLTITTGIPAAVAKYEVKQAILPITRMSSRGKMAMVFEILAVDWYLALEDTVDAVHTSWAYLATVTNRATGDVSSIATMAADVTDPLVLAFAQFHKASAVGYSSGMPIHIDLSDGAGNGVLIATDRLFLVQGQGDNTIVTRATAKITYRQSNVGVMEYVGIVQSQQG